MAAPQAAESVHWELQELRQDKSKILPVMKRVIVEAIVHTRALDCEDLLITRGNATPFPNIFEELQEQGNKCKLFWACNSKHFGCTD